jgi:DNA-binding transcriptional LysR family regulator
VRVNCNVPFGLHRLLPLIPRSTAANSEVRLDIVLADRVIDLMDERADVAIRLGPMRPSQSILRLQICVHQIQMSPSLPFRNVTGVGGRAAGGRGAPGVAQRPAGARLSGARNRTTCLPSERQLARLVERLSRP